MLLYSFVLRYENKMHQFAPLSIDLLIFTIISGTFTLETGKDAAARKSDASKEPDNLSEKGKHFGSQVTTINCQYN